MTTFPPSILSWKKPSAGAHCTPGGPSQIEGNFFLNPSVLAVALSWGLCHRCLPLCHKHLSWPKLSTWDWEMVYSTKGLDFIILLFKTVGWPPLSSLVRPIIFLPISLSHSLYNPSSTIHQCSGPCVCGWESQMFPQSKRMVVPLPWGYIVFALAFVTKMAEGIANFSQHFP